MLFSVFLFAVIIGLYLLCGLTVYFTENVIPPSKTANIKPVLPHHHDPER